MKTVFSCIKRNSGLLIIFSSFVIVIFSGLKSGVLPQALDSIRKADPFYILLALLCSVGHILISAFANRSFISKLGYDVSLKDAFYSAVAGSYYSSITPAGTGGFPVQIYYLGKRGVPVGVASSAVICFLNSWYTMKLLLMTLFLLMRRELLVDVLGSNMIFLIIGYLYNI